MNFMPGSTASPSNSRERVLLVGLNWIGDTVMAMPAVQAWRRLHPEAHLAVLVKPGLAGLWKLHGAPDEILTYTHGLGAALAAARRVRAGRFDRVFVLPHSIRSALIPFLAGVPERVGLPGAGRALMLHRVVQPSLDPARRHQGFEYLDVLAPGAPIRVLEYPQLILPPEARAEARRLAGHLPAPRLAVLPGAARGPAKRWPVDHFAAVCERWINETPGSVLVLGGRDDLAVAQTLAERLGPRALSLAGQTSLAGWAALLQGVDAVVANDSGGMHLAAAVGTPVVGIFGLTDPAQTGPLGPRVATVQEGAGGQRDIARQSGEAQKRLAALSPERVYEALQEVRATPPSA